MLDGYARTIAEGIHAQNPGLPYGMLAAECVVMMVMDAIPDLKVVCDEIDTMDRDTRRKLRHASPVVRQGVKELLSGHPSYESSFAKYFPELPT